MGIRIVDMHRGKYEPLENEILIKIDRSNPILGNKFIMTDESDQERNRVCDLYDTWFADKIATNDVQVLAELNKILEYSKTMHIALGCWCYPKRCHGQTIMNWLINNGLKNFVSPIKSNGKVFRCIIAGGREYKDAEQYENLKEKVDKMLSNKIKEGFEIEIISGCARGADTLAIMYATDRCFKLTRMPADWSLNNRSAGYIRNREMLDYIIKVPDRALIVFWDGSSKGTNHIIQESAVCGVQCKIFKY